MCQEVLAALTVVSPSPDHKGQLLFFGTIRIEKAARGFASHADLHRRVLDSNGGWKIAPKAKTVSVRTSVANRDVPRGMLALCDASFVLTTFVTTTSAWLGPVSWHAARVLAT